MKGGQRGSYGTPNEGGRGGLTWDSYREGEKGGSHLGRLFKKEGGGDSDKIGTC